MRFYNMILNTNAETLEKEAAVDFKEYRSENPITGMNNYIYRHAENGVLLFAYREEGPTIHAVFSYDEQKYSYGNGRYVRKMLEAAEMNLAERIAGSLADSAGSLAGSSESDHEAELTAEMLTTIDACDIPQVQTVNNTSAKARRIGFAV